MVNQFGRGLALDTDDTAVWMIEIRIETDHLPVRYRRDRRAVRRAKREYRALHSCLGKISHRGFENTLNRTRCLREVQADQDLYSRANTPRSPKSR